MTYTIYLREDGKMLMFRTGVKREDICTKVDEALEVSDRIGVVKDD